jgi:uncharacterized protein
MMIFLISLVVLLVIVAAMSIGVIMGRKPISGSCGGVGAALGEKDYVCDICGGDPNKCDENSDQDSAGKKAAELAYDASRG